MSKTKPTVLYDYCPRNPSLLIAKFEKQHPIHVYFQYGDDVSKSFNKAKSKKLDLITEQIKELQKQYEDLVNMTEEQVPVINDPYW